MINIFQNVKHLAKLKKLSIDNAVFRMHYKATVLMLLAFSIVVTSTQYIGEPISCIVGGIPPNVMNTYCWIYSTFTITDKLTGKVGKDIVQPGVASHNPDEDETKYHKYYQWVCFVLIFQAIFFYLPHYMWKSWEGGRTKSLVMGLNDPIILDSNKEDRKAALVKYFQRYSGSHNEYFWKFFLCELLNFVNVICQFFFTDFFLGGEFIDYGHKVLEYRSSNWEDNLDDPMSKVFPKVTKCIFHKFGPSGIIQNFDGLCLLPINILNEKLYTIIWFWLVFLMIVTAIVLVFRFVAVCSRHVKVISLTLGSKFVNRGYMNSIINKMDTGDWFVLSQLEKNMEDKVFAEIVEALATVKSYT